MPKVADLQWIVAPEDQGQIVEQAYAYAVDGEYIYRRTIDRSRPDTRYARALINERDNGETWNGSPADYYAEDDWTEIT